MKLYRFRTSDSSIVYVAREGDRYTRLAGDTIATLDLQATREPFDPTGATPLAPVAPGKIVAVGRNYADHARELGNEPPKEPIIFIKPPSAVIAPDEAIVRPRVSERVDFEGELAMVIGKRARHVDAADWRLYVLGFTCANDVTARDLQKRDVQFTRGKSFDTFCPLGPCIETDLDPANVMLTTRVNGQLRQHESTDKMIFSCATIVAFITGIMTLDPGDVILTGTPAGVGPIVSGETVEVEIEGIGVLRNGVRDE